MQSSTFKTSGHVPGTASRKVPALRQPRQRRRLTIGSTSSPASIAPTSTSGTLKMRPALLASPTRNWPQQSTDLAEELDRVLLLWLEAQGLPNQNAPLNSESPGLIIDRLSILALKLYNTREEADRVDA